MKKVAKVVARERLADAKEKARLEMERRKRMAKLMKLKK